MPRHQVWSQAAAIPSSVAERRPDVADVELDEVILHPRRRAVRDQEPKHPPSARLS